MKINEVLLEGGWDSVATQDTVITPAVVVKALRVVERFVKEFNEYAKEQGLAPVRVGHTTGSSSHYLEDLKTDPDKEYGDIDLQIVVPSREGDDQKTYSGIQKYWNDTWAAFIATGKPRQYVHPDSKSGHIIFKIGKDKYVQVDLMPHPEHVAKWARYRVTPERGLKGLLHGNLFSVLGDLLDINIQHMGALAKMRDGQRLPFTKTLKNYTLKTITQDIEHFGMDIFRQEYETIFKRAPNHTVVIDPMLMQHQGVDISQARASDLVKMIVGLARTFDTNKMYGKGNLSKYQSADEFLDKFLDIYQQKADKNLQSTKRDKAQTDAAIARAARDKRQITDGLEKIRLLFAQVRAQ